MTYLLIIWIYQASVYYEVLYPSLEECREHEEIAHTWDIPIVTQCVENPRQAGEPSEGGGR